MENKETDWLCEICLNRWTGGRKCGWCGEEAETRMTEPGIPSHWHETWKGERINCPYCKKLFGDKLAEDYKTK